MSEENKKPESLDEFREGLEQTVDEVWSKTLQLLNETEDDSLTPEDFFKLLGQSKAYDEINGGVDGYLERQISDYFEELNDEDAQYKFSCELGLKKPEMYILGSLTRSFENFIELIHIEGYIEKPKGQDETIWGLMSAINKSQGKEIFSKKIFDKNKEEEKIRARKDYSKVMQMGLMKWLEVELNRDALDQFRICEKTLIESGVLNKPNPNLVSRFKEKAVPIFLLIQKKLSSLKPEDGEL
jgi:hypothetical protein